MGSKRINIEEFYNDYISLIQDFNVNQQDIISNFISKEKDLDTYIEEIEALEKRKIAIGFDIFEKELTEMTAILMDFNPIKIEESTAQVKGAQLYLDRNARDLENLAKAFETTKATWYKIALIQHNIDPNSFFATKIEEEFQDIEKDIKNLTIDNVERLSDRISSLKNSINHILSTFMKIKKLFSENTFIGDEAIAYYERALRFIQYEYKENNLFDIENIVDKLLEDFETLKKQREFVQKKIPIYKVVNNTNMDDTAYSYAAKINQQFFNLTSIDFSNPKYVKTGHFVYVNFFPIHGIFGLREIFENMRIPDDYFEANKEFTNKTFNAFLGTVGIDSLILISYFMGLNIFVAISMVLASPFVYKAYFKYLIKATYKKFKLDKMFFYIKNDYFFVKEGDDLLNPLRIEEILFKNFDIIFKTEKSKQIQQKG